MMTYLAQIAKQYSRVVPAVEGEEGQGLVEYALIIVLVSIASVGVNPLDRTTGIT